MATIHITDRRGALYWLRDSSGAYNAPTQGSDAALAVIDFSCETVGGPEEQDGDMMPVGGGTSMIMAPYHWKGSFTTRVPVWPDVTDGASHPLYSVLQSGALSVNTAATPNRVVATPTSSDDTSSGALALASFTFIDGDEGDAYAGYNCGACLTSIKREGSYLLMSWEFAGKFESVSSADDEGLTATDAFADIVFADPIEAKGATWVSGITGQAGVNLANWEFVPGCRMVMQESQTETNGFARPSIDYYTNPRFTFEVSKNNEAAFQAWVESLAQSENTVSVSYGSGAAAFTISMLRGRYMFPKLKSSNNVRMYDLEVLGQANAGNDQFTMTWGA